MDGTVPAPKTLLLLCSALGPRCPQHCWASKLKCHGAGGTARPSGSGPKSLLRSGTALSRDPCVHPQEFPGAVEVRPARAGAAVGGRWQVPQP